MKIEPSAVQVPVTNFDGLAQEGALRKHGNLFNGTSKRALVVGPSGSGKTNVMISLLTHPNGLRLENVYLYCKSLYQPKYKYLRELLTPLREIGYYEYSEDENIAT
ncbi:unnamed protein product [Acanthoscelides obtectus]|uniref:Uncharacterized protein n=1 Tax=Acanthoscelides obtectus TaxID=200917 RepID=A0A9P0K009_ACAOB|nr:unnamed protein product [Acanthoscelides obtectus]CAK1640789.1 hypothetical protein AOBTE_LOCUS11929 [Acanthoscelides obtectus]